jgi:two-component system, NtrC family, response regulator HydG
VNAVLKMSVGPQSGAVYELSNTDANLLGRDWQCRVVLNDPQCSRVHARIWMDEEGWWVKDEGSSNGTFVNDQRIDQARLAHNNELRVGGCVFVLQPSEGRPRGPVVRDEHTRLTVRFDEQFNPDETGQYTLGLLKDVKQGEDFFFLFQLSIKLLGTNQPDEVVRICMQRIWERTNASVAGFLWLSDQGQLKPKIVYPGNDTGSLALDEELTQRVVKKRRAIRLEHETKDSEKYADSICVPLITDDIVIGAIHLYRREQPFLDSHFQLARSVANIMAIAMVQANRQASLEAEKDRLAQGSADTDELIGDCEGLKQLKSKIKRIAKASGCVLIRGESGAGKELVARALHQASPRANRPMLSVNCAAIPRELVESQLFGHKKGAFTSADRDHQGWFQQADLGTLFLDEIGELTLEGQAKLLRILEGHPFLPVGGTEEITVDVRVICATNRDLRDFVAEKQFREDLYYRLTVFELSIPPLRERGPDIGRLIDHFLNHFRIQHGRSQLEISDDAREKLISYQWPGNVRQLRNVIDSAVVMAEGSTIEVEDLGIRDSKSDEPDSLVISEWEHKLIKLALQRTENNVPKSAKLLGISRATLYRKIEEYGIKR